MILLPSMRNIPKIKVYKSTQRFIPSSERKASVTMLQSLIDANVPTKNPVDTINKFRLPKPVDLALASAKVDEATAKKRNRIP